MPQAHQSITQQASLMVMATRSLRPDESVVHPDRNSTVVVVEHTDRHAATYWLFKHVEGLCRVPIPETALFDAEGVLEAWIFAPVVATRRRDANSKPQAVGCQVVRREVLETNVLRLEARLQVRFTQVAIAA